MGKILYEDLSKRVIGTAMDVLNELKPGLDEKLYERALMVGLRMAGHAVDAQKVFPVSYRGELIGNLTPDLIVDGKSLWTPKWLPPSMKRTSPKW
jgi:GxxExxY protein